MLGCSAGQDPHKTALYCGDRCMSYAELDQSTTRLARWFLEEGLRPGDRVAIHWSNSIEVVQLFFAIFKAGLIAVPLNLRLKSVELAYILGHSQAAFCFSEPALASLIEGVKADCPSLRRILTELPNADASAELPEVLEDQPAAILYTSGTTARPKGTTHTHKSFLHTTRIMVIDLSDHTDTILVVTQMLHASGLNAAMLPAIYLGISAVLVPAFDPGLVLDLIERFRCTYAIALPALLLFVVEEQTRQPRDVSCLRTWIAGGDVVSVHLQERFQALFGIPVQEVYGMTETLLATLNPRDALRPGSIGKAKPGFEVSIMDFEGKAVPDGETGEIVIRSLANCVGYWNDPAATEELFRDGWLQTGDLGSRDTSGYYWFRGRKKEIIVRAGSNISPQEVEEALYIHPAVLEAGVIGVPDETYGERIIAFVALRAGDPTEEQELREHARQILADYKVPERIFLVPQLPKGLTGKVQRRALKELVPALQC